MIAKILHTQQSNFSVKYLNGSRQAGSTDCGLYSIAAVTCSLLGKHPTKVAFDQKALHLHLVNILEVKAFPIAKKKRVVERISRIEYCFCSLPDNKDKMISSDQCEEWFHLP